MDGRTAEKNEVKIVKRDAASPDTLRIFAEYDDFMLGFLGEDAKYYARYDSAENIQAVWLAYAGGETAGCAAFRGLSAEIGELKRLFVKEEYRRRGVSRLLARAVEEHARASGCRILTLGTRATLAPAMALYKSIGYHETNREGLYLEMEKTL